MEVAKRIFEYNKNAKFIYIIRDPIERIKSHYRHNWIKGYTRKSFVEQVLKPGEVVKMPVAFYIDPKIYDENNTKNLKEITLSYTFFKVKLKSKDKNV